MSKKVNLSDVENLAVVLRGPKDLRLEKWPLPEVIESNEILIQSHSCGICGSDTHLWQHGALADFKLTEPLVMGHEPSGTVVDVGSNVTNFKSGDRVALEHALACLRCNFCKDGRYNLCPRSNTTCRGFPPTHGCLRRYFTHPAEFAHKLPENVSFTEGAMCQPFAVLVHACRRLDVTAGQNVLILGAGTIGIMAMICAKAFGANKISITDIDGEKLKLAKDLGADFTYLIDPKNFDAESLGNKIKNDMNEPPEVSMECTGFGSSVRLAIYTTQFGGKIGLIGLGREDKVPLAVAAMREIDLISVCRFTNDYPLTLSLMASKKVNLKPLCTKIWKIENALDAFEQMKNGTAGTIKSMIEMN